MIDKSDMVPKNELLQAREALRALDEGAIGALDYIVHIFLMLKSNSLLETRCILHFLV